jgi:mannose-6-phosphate isomerase
VLKDYIWGGRELERLLGRRLPEGITAESWEISDHPHGETLVADGPWAGSALGRLLATHGTRLVGSRNQPAVDRGRFPLLIKLLDANDWLSIQVHPGDEYSLEHEGDLGKTEMWVALHARPGAEIILGFETAPSSAELRDALASGDIETLFRRVPVKPGDIFFVPAGVVHAIGPGLVLAEIQQTSDVTYRLHDWGRTAGSGPGRPLHVAQALAVADFDAVGQGAIRPQRLEASGVEHELLVDCPYFRTERIGLEDATFDAECDGSTFEIWASLSGQAWIETRRGNIELNSVSWALLPAELGRFQIRSPESAQLLRIFTPASPD